MHLILSLQAFARSSIIGNTASALTAQKDFLNNFKNVLNHRVDIQEDIRCYQDSLSYTSNKIDHSMGENIYMLPIDMNLNISLGTLGYNNKILDPMVRLVWEKMIRLIRQFPHQK